MTYICPGCGTELVRETDLTKPGLVIGEEDFASYRCPSCEVTYTGVDLPEK